LVSRSDLNWVQIAMSPSDPTETESPPTPEPPSFDNNAHTDFIGSLGWITLGIAILVGSLTMDRLEAQHINPHTVPGLLPGLLGIGMIFFGSLMCLRSVRNGGLKRLAAADPKYLAARRKRLTLVLALCLTFGVVLVGHGLPFWLAAMIFVSGSILILQHAERKATGRELTLRALLVALVIGLAAGGMITLVFQELFLVRLP
jgi:hypothetical protein